MSGLLVSPLYTSHLQITLVNFMCIRNMLIIVLHMKQILNLAILCKG